MHALTRKKAGCRLEKDWPLDVFAPRLMRRIYAVFSRIWLAGGGIPSFLGSILLGGFFAAVLLFGIVAGGHGEAAFKVLTSTLGLGVSRIDIASLDGEPLTYISEIDVLEAVGLDGESAMLTFDVRKAHERIVALPFVHSAILRKSYPNHLQIIVKERRPVALWQHQGRLDVIDEQGVVLVPFHTDMGRGLDLPLLVGQGANKEGAQILALAEKIAGTEKFSDFGSRIRAYRRVADRRWDIILDNGVEIKLPEQGFEGRLMQMLALDEAQDLVERDVLGIDLRLDDRIGVTLSDEAMARWRDEAPSAGQMRKRQVRG